MRAPRQTPSSDTTVPTQRNQAPGRSSAYTRYQTSADDHHGTRATLYTPPIHRHLRTQDSLHTIGVTNVDVSTAFLPTGIPGAVRPIAGRLYAVTDADLRVGAPAAWLKIAANHGMTAANLRAFNATVILKRGTRIHIPSSDEIVYAELKAADAPNAVQEFTRYLSSRSRKTLLSARKRASGVVGRRYAKYAQQPGDPDGADYFYTQNRRLRGARRPTTVDGAREYQVDWGNINKCNVFMNDNVWASGYQVPYSSRGHYVTAGTVQNYHRYYKPIPATDARPGHLIQFYGGTKANESHNLILSSYVKISRLPQGNRQRWRFTTIAAEHEGAMELERDFAIERRGAEFEITDGPRRGKTLRFFAPRRRRS